MWQFAPCHPPTLLPGLPGAVGVAALHLTGLHYGRDVWPVVAKLVVRRVHCRLVAGDGATVAGQQLGAVDSRQWTVDSGQ